MGKLPQILIVKEADIETLQKVINKYLSGESKITKGNYKILTVETRCLEAECSATITYQLLLPNETIVRMKKLEKKTILRIKAFNKKFVGKCKKLEKNMIKGIKEVKISEFFKRSEKENEMESGKS